MNYCGYCDYFLINLVNNAVTVSENLANGFIVELRNDPTHERKIRQQGGFLENGANYR